MSDKWKEKRLSFDNKRREYIGIGVPHKLFPFLTTISNQKWGKGGSEHYNHTWP